MEKRFKKIYISGPISGLPRKEYLKRFEDAAMRYESYRWTVVSPTWLAPCRHPWLYRLMGYRLTLAYDLWQMMRHRCSHIHMLKGWKQSLGARIERAVAIELGMVVLYEEKQPS